MLRCICFGAAQAKQGHKTQIGCVQVFTGRCDPNFLRFDNHFTRNIGQTFRPVLPNANAFGNLKSPIVHP